MLSRRDFFKAGTLAAGTLATSSAVLAESPKHLLQGGKDFSRRS